MSPTVAEASIFSKFELVFASVDSPPSKTPSRMAEITFEGKDWTIDGSTLLTDSMK